MKKSDKYIKLIIPAVLAAIFMSCTERMDLDPDNSDPVLVVYGTFSDKNSIQKINLQSSAPYFKPLDRELIKNADVTVTDGSGETYILRDISATGGIYSALEKIEIMPGETYTLNINLDEDKFPAGKTYTTSSTVPEPVALDSLTIEKTTLAGIDFYNLFVYGADPPGPNYYVFTLEVNGVLKTPYLSKVTVMDDKYFDGQKIDKLAFGSYMSSKHQGSISDSDNIIYLSPGDEVKLNMLTVEKGYYDFVRECQSQKNGSNPLIGGPPSNIASNIPGGVGFFTAYCVTSVTAIVPPEGE